MTILSVRDGENSCSSKAVVLSIFVIYKIEQAEDDDENRYLYLSIITITVTISRIGASLFSSRWMDE